MNRREFLATSAAVVAAPLAPPSEPVTATIRTGTNVIATWPPVMRWSEAIVWRGNVCPGSHVAMLEYLRAKWFREEIESDRRFDAWIDRLENS